jgi:glucokinase
MFFHIYSIPYKKQILYSSMEYLRNENLEHMKMDLKNDKRIVLTLDAGGTNFRFSAICGGRTITETVKVPSGADNLDKCLANIVNGFTSIMGQCPAAPAAISFAFPGPADYPNGIIGDLPNLPAFRGGIALGPMLEDKFGLPVFINNDGDLFVYGEAIAGFLPYVNGLLEKAGSPRRYKNLFGVTFGTGFGAGIVINGTLLAGDNAISGEIWLLRNKLDPGMSVEESVSIRALRRFYAKETGIPFEESPEPRHIFEIGAGARPGNAPAAIEAFRRMGEVAGDAIANALTLVDGLAVIGGGISAAAPLFLPPLVAELNSTYRSPDGKRFPRLASTAFNLEDPDQLKTFLAGDPRVLQTPGSGRTVVYDVLRRVGIGLSRLGTSEAVAVGAYAYALQKLNKR